MPRPKSSYPDREERMLALVEWRRRLGITQAQAAKLLNYSKPTIQDMEHGRAYVNDDVMRMIQEHEHL
jgi:DNA-binding XRE family transcriptional regulator